MKGSAAVTTVALTLIVACQLTLAQVENAVACASCCTQLNDEFDSGPGIDENVMNVFTCQTQGCVVGTDCSEIADTFNRRGCEVGQAFLQTGFTTLLDGDEAVRRSKFFCSVGGELSSVEYTDDTHTQLLNNNSQCFDCCSQLNVQFDFDTNDGYSVQACRERCRGLTDIPSGRGEIDVFDESSGQCVKDPDDIERAGPNFFFNGCVIGTEMLEQGFVDFKGIRHYCQTVRRDNSISTELESVGAVVATVFNDDTVGVANNDCSTCCDGLDAELDDVGETGAYNVEACKEDGCHANQFCEILTGTDRAGCEIGKSFLTTGKVEFAGQAVLCQKGGVVTGAVIDVNEALLLEGENNDAELVGIGVGSTLAGVLLLALVALYVVKRSAAIQASKDVMTPQPRDYAYSEDSHNAQTATYFGGGNYTTSSPP